MKAGRPFSFRARLNSFRHAWSGLKTVIREEHNARIHLMVMLVALGAAWYFRITPAEWAMVLLCIGLVVSLEIVNSAIEKLADAVSPERNEQIKRVKDLAAAAVLVSAIIAAVVGLMVFVPRIIEVALQF